MKLEDLKPNDLISARHGLTKNAVSAKTGRQIGVSIKGGQIMAVEAVSPEDPNPHFTASYHAIETNFAKVTITFVSTDAPEWLWLKQIPGLGNVPKS